MGKESVTRAVLAARIIRDLYAALDAEAAARKLGLSILDDHANTDLVFSIERRGDVWSVTYCDLETFEAVQTGDGPTFWSALTQCIRDMLDTDDPASPQPSHLSVVGGTEHSS